MIDPLIASGKLSSAGLEAQSARLRVVSENIANANSTGRTPGSDPYRAKQSPSAPNSIGHWARLRCR